MAYTMWGVFPLFWKLLTTAGAVETLAHRIVWSCLITAAMVAALGMGFGWLRPTLAGGRWRLLLAAAILVSVNWGVFIWAVQHRFVVEASLGYFINPLVSVLLGVIFFAERLSRWGMLGIAFASIGVVVISAEHVRTLWVSLALAFSFGFYGVVKKRLTIPALQGLFVESAVVTPLSLVYLVWLEGSGKANFAHSLSLSLLFMAGGAVTLVPLWLFASAAQGLGLGTLGVLQYIGPTLQLLIGLLVFGQYVTTSYWLGLVMVWAGSALYLAWVLRSGRRTSAARPADDSRLS